jgi:hypothetical protein
MAWPLHPLPIGYSTCMLPHAHVFIPTLTSHSALGLFVPPAFHNITWKTFIIFGVLCFGAAAQAFVSYPETARKSLEEIEEMFRDGALRPWQTKVGGSHLDERIAAVRERKGSVAMNDEKDGHAVKETRVENNIKM